MTQLSRRAESERLCLLLGVPPERLAFLADMPTHETHVLVQAVLRAQSSIGVATLQPLIFWAQRLPPRWLAAISQWWLSPVVVAMLATRLPAARASRIAEYLDAGYLAEVCADLDPRAARDIIRRLSQKQLVRTALALLARRCCIRRISSRTGASSITCCACCPRRVCAMPSCWSWIRSATCCCRCFR